MKTPKPDNGRQTTKYLEVRSIIELEDFQFRWLENNVIEIGKQVSISLMFNHLN